MARLWQSSIIKLVRSRNLIHVKISLSLHSDVLARVCFCVRVSADRRLGQTDRSVRLRHLNSCELHPAIPLLRWLLGPRRFSIFPDRRSLGIWLSNQRGPAALLIYDLASQHSAGPIHHLHLGFFVVFTLQDLSALFVACLLIILPERSLRNQLN